SRRLPASVAEEWTVRPSGSETRQRTIVRFVRGDSLHDGGRVGGGEFRRMEGPAACGGEASGQHADTAGGLRFKDRRTTLWHSHANIMARMRTVDVIRHKRDGGQLD